jgi:hypothetical protein
LENGKEVTILPEQSGWFKKVILKGCFGKMKTYKPIKGRLTELKVSEAYIFRVYEVSAPKKCPVCDHLVSEGRISGDTNFDMLRIMSLKSGIFHRCFSGAIASRSGVSGDYTEWFMNWDDKKCWKLIKEEAIDREEVFKRYMQGELNYVSDFDLIQELENRTGRNF